MARVKGILQMTGGLQNLSFYTVKGSDTVYVRSKGGPSKRRMKTGEEFAELRKHQMEWATCVAFSKELKTIVGDVAKLGDFNVSPVWNGLGKKIIALDTERPVGERRLRLTQCPAWLTGYNLNKNFPFNSVFRSALQFDLNKEQLRVTVTIPHINTANDLYNIQKLPYFRLVFSFGIMADFNPESKSVTTGWFPSSGIIDRQAVEIGLDADVKERDRENVTFIVSAGIQFGKAEPDGSIEAVKNACCGKIVMADVF